MPNKHISLDGIFSALADPTRRSVLQRLSTQPAPVSDLAEPFEMTLPSFMQHLDVLEDCGLVRSRKKGWRSIALCGKPALSNWTTISSPWRSRHDDSLDCTTRSPVGPRIRTHCRRPARTGVESLDHARASQTLVYSVPMENH